MAFTLNLFPSCFLVTGENIRPAVLEMMSSVLYIKDPLMPECERSFVHSELVRQLPNEGLDSFVSNYFEIAEFSFFF
jgi:hypothetical protein